MRYVSWLETILFRGTAAVLIFVVFVGAVCPPLYEGVLPHDHLFVGGPPPVDWESNHHDNPLAALLGGSSDEAPVQVSEPAIQGIVEIEQERTGRVVSLYAAPSALVISVVALAMTIPGLLLLRLLVVHGTVEAVPATLTAAEPDAPRPPPPRRSAAGTPVGLGSIDATQEGQKMSHLTRFLTAVGVAVALLAVLVPTAALAHEKRAVGKYTFLVGFVNEPTIQNQPNGVDLTITDANDKPVQGAEKTLKVAVAYAGGSPKELELNASDEAPGKYSASFIPTKAGSYSFIFSGSLNGDPINATFQSGPNTFDDVVSPTDLQFPVAVPAPADLAQQTQDANATAQAALQRATLFGVAGIAVGLIGIIVGGIALVTRSNAAVPRKDDSVAKAEY